jgi:CDP-diacylglycerol--glycerol-3-phosphate 3-phosphatidyltransferase
VVGQTSALNLPPSSPDRAALRRLRRRWALTALAYAVALLGGYWLLAGAWTPELALWWLGFAGAAMVLELGILWWILPTNHPPSEAVLLPTFGYGTTLTLVCGLLLFLLAGFLFAPRPDGWLGWLPAVLYTTARVVDYVDGYVARITQHETKLGGILDMELDGLGVLIAILLGIQYGVLPLWYLPLALSRQLFILGIWWRTRRGLPVYAMTPSSNRRIIAGYQTGFLTVALWPPFGPPTATLAAVIFALPLVASFARDWWVVSGMLDPHTLGYARGRRWAKALVEGWLPLLGRMVGGVVALRMLLREVPDFAGWLPTLTASGWADPLPWLWLLVGVCGLTLLPYLLGILGRVTALPLLVLAWLDIAAYGLDWSDNGLLFVAAAVVTHAGSGRLALWRPEDPLLNRRPGTPAAP